MQGRKSYGNYRVERCPFCKKQATATNSEGMPVCYEHKNEKMPLLKCMCGEMLDMRKGKFGIFFSCMRCGIVRKDRALEMNEKSFGNPASEKRSPAERNDEDKEYPEQQRGAPREMVIRSDDPRYCD